MNPDQTSKPAIVVPVFNRRETTLRCIRHLEKLGVLSWARVYVVDDASTDGTAEALRTEFPQVQIIKGDGSLWWGGGINLGTRAALADGAPFVFWLNDDCLPQTGALEKLLDVSRERNAVSTAVVRLLETGECHMGGWRRTFTTLSIVIPKDGAVESCETSNGNCLCIPSDVLEKVGLVDASRIPHVGADADFGLRVTKAGFAMFVVGDAVCDLSDPPLKNRRSWLFGEITVSEIWRNSFHRQSGNLSLPAWRLRWRHWGIVGVLACVARFFRLVLTSVARLMVPQHYLRKWFGRFSHTHRVHSEYEEWLKTCQTNMADSSAQDGASAPGSKHVSPERVC